MANEKKGLNPLATGVAGAIIGAAAAAAAIALSDEKNRKKVEGVLGSLQKQGDSVLKEITKKAMELKDAVGKNARGVRKLSGKKK
ncbi:hypothetical protein HYU45_03435 [Candidatus Daviesbacteria bacterium]|nr:hypothetical protein [Candidatus Daviesbacteria bacterium]